MRRRTFLGGAACGFLGRGPLGPERWRADLAFLSVELPKRHANLSHSLSKEEFETAVRRLDALLGELSELEICAGLVRLVAAARDAHTRVWAFRDGPRLPVRLFEFPEGLFVTQAREAERQRIGSKVLAIGGIDIESLRRSLAEFVSAENRYGVMAEVPRLIANEQALQAAGAEPVFEVENGGQRSVWPLRAGNASLVDTAEPGAEAPVSWRDRSKPYWMQPLERRRAVYVQ